MTRVGDDAARLLQEPDLEAEEWFRGVGGAVARAVVSGDHDTLRVVLSGLRRLADDGATSRQRTRMRGIADVIVGVLDVPANLPGVHSVAARILLAVQENPMVTSSELVIRVRSDITVVSRECAKLTGHGFLIGEKFGREKRWKLTSPKGTHMAVRLSQLR